jgi:hypothetical protein
MIDMYCALRERERERERERALGAGAGLAARSSMFLQRHLQPSFLKLHRIFSIKKSYTLMRVLP